MYQRKLNQLQVKLRGALVGLVHAKSLRSRVESGQADQGGKAMTLMSTDIDSITTSGEMFHEVWAQVIEVLVGTTLLYLKVAWFAFLPLAIVFGKPRSHLKAVTASLTPISQACSRMSAYVAAHLQNRQKAWTVATQKRLSYISLSLGKVKSLKILGFGDAMEVLIKKLRTEEISKSIQLRWIMVTYNASGE